MGDRLVRDGCLRPGNWRVPGAENQVGPVRDLTEHRRLLKKKLFEELGELIEAMDEDSAGKVTEELGDLSTVMHAVSHVYGISWSDVLEALENKLDVYGGFLDGTVWRVS